MSCGHWNWQESLGGSSASSLQACYHPGTTLNCLHHGAGLFAGALITSEMHCRIQNTAEDTEGGKLHLQWNFSMFLMSSVSFPQKGTFNNSFPIALQSGILPEFWLKVRAVQISNLISSPDIMGIILCRTDFWKYVLSYFPCTIHPLESPRALAVGQLLCVTAGSKSQSHSQGG